MSIPDWVVLVACLLAVVGLIAMAVMGHNRAVIIMAVSYLWLAIAYASYLAGFIDASARMIFIRAGIFVLGVSTFGASLIWWFNRRQHG